YDYKMIDADYLLAPVAGDWFADPRARSRTAAFLAAPAGGPGARTRGAALVDNLRYVLKSAAAFAADPQVTNLIALKGGCGGGDWGDREAGLGAGRYPYDVNAVLVPAALRAAAQLNESGALAPYLSAADKAVFARAAHMALPWRSKAPPLFTVTIS